VASLLESDPAAGLAWTRTSPSKSDTGREISEHGRRYGHNLKKLRAEFKRRKELHMSPERIFRLELPCVRYTSRSIRHAATARARQGSLGLTTAL
jgi:hypothetical protein